LPFLRGSLLSLIPFAVRSNRSAAHLRLKDFEEALSDAEACVTLQPSWDKGHFRKGAALENIDLRRVSLEVFDKI
jgi:stress-induced-phosphoprotein 1